MDSVEKQCKEILCRQHMKRIIKTTISNASDSIPRLEYTIDTEAIQELADTCFGKNIPVTNQEAWDDVKIIKAYRSQFIIEDVFKEMKDRATGSWWPLHHWTNAKITVHGLYCTIALFLQSLGAAARKESGAGPVDEQNACGA